MFLWSVIGCIALVGVALPYVRFAHGRWYADHRPAMLTILVSVFLIWTLGRPFLVLVSDRMRRPVPPGTKTGVSIIVPCHDAADRLPNLVARLLAQTYRPLEIVLVENNSTDDTWGVLLDLAGDHPEVKIHAVDTDPAEYPASVAINIGIATASYDVILRMDDDTYLRRDAVANGLAELQAARAVAIACDLRVANPTASVWTRLQSMEYLLAMDVDRRSQALLDSVLCCSGAMSMFRKDVILRAGGFVSAPPVVSEDMDMTLKAHRFGRVAMAPECIGFTDVPESLVRLTHQRFRWAISGTVSLYLHRGGIANVGYWHNPLVGFVGLPLRLVSSLRDLLAPVFILDICLLLMYDGPIWFAILFGVRALVMLIELLLLVPALNRVEVKQGLSNWWLIPSFVLAFGPFLLLVRFLGSWAGVIHISRLRHRGDVVYQRGLSLRHLATVPG